MVWQVIYMSMVAVVWLIGSSRTTRMPLAVRPLSVLLGVILVVELTSNYLVVHERNNQWLYHIYNPIEYAFLAFLYAKSSASLVIRRWIYASVVAFALFCLLNAICWQPLSQPPTYAFQAEWLLVLLLLVHYFYALYHSNELIIITREPMLWISIGNFFFYAGTFFLMSLIFELEKRDLPLARDLYHINTVLNIVMYGFWAVGFLCDRLFRTSH